MLRWYIGRLSFNTKISLELPQVGQTSIVIDVEKLGYLIINYFNIMSDPVRSNARYNS